MSGAVVGIQARLSSTRLPGKVLADLGGRPLIERVVERARAAALVDEVVVLTSVEPSDDPLARHLEARGIPFRRGPLADVLQRYADLLGELEPDYIVRVTGDCPLIEPAFIDLQLQALRHFDADFVTVAGNETGAVDGTLCGQGAFSARALARSLVSDDPRDREHVASFWFREHAAEFRHVEVEVDPIYRRPGLRLAVDEPADLALVRAVWEACDTTGEGLFPLDQALAWLDAHPDVRALNGSVIESADNRALRTLEHEQRIEVVGRWPVTPTVAQNIG